MSDQAKIALVTGANRGLGLETCRQLLDLGVQVILTSRSEQQGRAAADSLGADPSQLIYHPLDVTDEQSVRRLAAFVQERFGRLDILVNNAGVLLDDKGEGPAGLMESDLETIRATFETNTLGVIRLLQALAPLMPAGANVVNVSSGMGQLSDMEGYYPGYRISKTALNAVTRIAAAELAEQGIRVNALCPGWVRTDMGGPNAERSVEQGVETIVWLATRGEEGESGGFYRDREPIPW